MNYLVWPWTLECDLSNGYHDMRFITLALKKYASVPLQIKVEKYLSPEQKKEEEERKKLEEQRRLAAKVC